MRACSRWLSELASDTTGLGAPWNRIPEGCMAPSRMRLLAFHQRTLSVNLGKYTRRWRIRSNCHLKPECLADFVRAKRLKENLTMKELAHQLGMGQMSLKYYEMHKSPPTGRNRTLLVGYLGFDPG